MRKNLQCICLIPARAGSERIKDKNIKTLGRHPLIAYTIQTALDAEVFDRVIVSTDSRKYAKIASYYGAQVPFLRPKRYATSTSPDIEWVKYTLKKLIDRGVIKHHPDPPAGGEGSRRDSSAFGLRMTSCFSILRPTNPFRKAVTIRRAFKEFIEDSQADSLRAVEKCSQHPAKMWLIAGNRMKPVIANPDHKATPWHSRQYQTLPPVYVQNASLEIAWTYLPLKKNTISGEKIIPFITEGFEGYDINDEKDWIYAEYLIRRGKVKLPSII